VSSISIIFMTRTSLHLHCSPLTTTAYESQQVFLKAARHHITEILLMLALYTNQSINQSILKVMFIFVSA